MHKACLPNQGEIKDEILKNDILSSSPDAKAIGDIVTYWSHFTIAFGVLPCQAKIQHETGMASIWCVAHCKIGLKIQQPPQKKFLHKPCFSLK